MTKLIAILYLAIICLSFVPAETILSKTYCVIDCETGKIIQAKDHLIPLPPASTIKLLTAMVVLDKVPLDREFVTSPNATKISPTKLFLQEGEKMSCQDLLLALLVKSANDAAIVLAEGVAQTTENFAILMNKKAEEIGCKKSYFVNSSGLPAPNQYSCAYDLALIAMHAARYPKICEFLAHKQIEVSTSSGRKFSLSNHNKLLSHKGQIVYGKTGWTTKSLNTFAGFSKISNKTIAVAILGAPKRAIMWQELLSILGYSNPPDNSTLEKNTKNIQLLLQKRGYYSGKIDGIYGNQTKSAVKKFQQDHGLNPDGIVGPDTWKKLTNL